MLSSLAFIAIAGSCAPDDTDSQELSLVWEAWDVTNSTYVDTADLDLEQVVGGMITAMLDAGEKPAYPFLAQLNNVTGRPPKDVPSGLNNVWRAWQLYEKTWGDLDLDVLANSAIGGMMVTLDDSSVEHLSPAEYQEARQQQEESYEGIGAFVVNQEDKLVLSPMQGGPAARAGLRAGDAILEVDGEPVADKSLQDVVDLVRGLAGSRVTLLIERADDPEPQEFNVIRDDIFTTSASPGLLPGAVGYIYISDFQEDTSEEILDILENFDQVETLALILDLRFNSEGTIESVQRVANEFLSDGLLMYELHDGGQRKDWEIVGRDNATQELPMVVIVNEATAMAAEVLAGALQDAERAVIIGDRTSGEGSESVFKELSDGSALKLPVSRWYTPSGLRIQDRGIEPDTVILFTNEDRVSGFDPQLSEAYEYLDNQLPLFR